MNNYDREDWLHCEVCGAQLVTRHSGPLPGCPQGISTAVCPTDPSHASQPPQASPSNEVTPEMLEAGFAAQCEELPEFGNENRENMMRVARVTIEAALKARKPADDGAGQ